MHIIYVYKTRLLRFLTLHFVAFIRHCSTESFPTLINILWKYCVNDCTYTCKNILQQPSVDILNTLWFISLCVSLVHILIIFLKCLLRKQEKLCKAWHGTCDFQWTYESVGEPSLTPSHLWGGYPATPTSGSLEALASGLWSHWVPFFVCLKF